MNKLRMAVLLAAASVCTTSWAHGGNDGYREYRDHREYRDYRDRGHSHSRYTVVNRVIERPVVVVREVPVYPVTYRERVVYRDRGATNYDYRHDSRGVSSGDGNQRLIGQTIGAIAGAALGNQIGKGNGRVAATAVGAVLGAAVGGSVVR